MTDKILCGNLKTEAERILRKCLSEERAVYEVLNNNYVYFML